jgi:cytochrome c-type biogenesis protein CcmF
MLLLLFVAFFAFFGNLQAGWKVARGNWKMVGGALAHVGVAIMILGIIASSGFNNTLTDAPDRENFIIARGQTKVVEGFVVTYEGSERNERGRGVYTLTIADPEDRAFQVNPVAYQSNTGEWIEHPDVKKFFERDVFVSVSPAARFAEEIDETENGGTLTLAVNDSTVVGDQEYAIHFVGFDTRVEPEFVPDSAAVAVAAVLNVTNLITREARELRPIYLVMEDGSQQYVQNRVRDWDLSVTFAGMNVTTGEADFVLEGVKLMPEDWVLVQARTKPFIGLLWIGSIVMTIGFGIAFVRRRQEQRYREERGLI